MGEWILICIDILKQNMNKLILRWEKDSWKTFPLSIPIVFKSAFIGDYPSKYKFFRVGYGLYRQIARRRSSALVDDKLFNSLTKILNVESSTVESFTNYPDMFMTSEISCVIGTE